MSIVPNAYVNHGAYMGPGLPLNQKVANGYPDQ